MEEWTTFDKLTRALSREERAEMLRSVLALKGYGDEPLAAEAPEDAQPGLNVESLHLGFFQRIAIFLRALLSGREKYEILREVALKRMGAEIQRRAPGLIDLHRGSFLPRMYEELEGLKRSGAVLMRLLNHAFGPRREEFVAVLAGYLLPEVQARLESLEDPSSHAETYEGMGNSEIRHAVTEEFERVISQIPTLDRRRAYQQMQSLHYLLDLLSYPVDEALECFTRDERGEMRGDLGKLRKHIVGLDALLHAARLAPSATTMQALAVFSHGDEIGREGFDLPSEVLGDSRSAAEALAAIRGFNASVPMTMLVRYVSGELEYAPRETGGGEDWFVLLRRFWSARIDRGVKGFIRRRERDRLYDEAASFLGLRRLPPLDLDGMPSVCRDPVEAHSIALRFLLGLYETAIYRLYRPLTVVLEEGRFYKADNRRELREIFSSLNRLDESIRQLIGGIVDRCTPAEEARLAVTEEDKRREAETAAQLAAKIDGEIGTFLDRRSTEVRTLTLLLEGVLHGTPGQQYDSLANLDLVGESQNASIVQACEEGLEMLTDALSVLQEIRKWV